MKAIIKIVGVLLCPLFVLSCENENMTKEDEINAKDSWETEVSKNTLDIKSTYVDTFDAYDTLCDVTKNFGVVTDSPDIDQSAKFQSAINYVSAIGGGKLYIPRGEYRINDVFLKSNVHIVVEENSVFRPTWIKGKKAHIFLFSHENPLSEGDYIENCSIRATKGHYYIDFTDRPTNAFWGGRFARICMAKNFSIADFHLKDNFTIYCATSMTPLEKEYAKDWEINRPTDGQIINSIHTNAHPGYGLCQIQGARRIYFENITSIGGVTLRLETGASIDYGGVFDIHARYVKNYDGYAALMMGPHSIHNGTVLVDGLWAEGSMKTYGTSAGTTTDSVDGKPGDFASDSKVVNIHGIMGGNAQVSKKSVYAYDPSQYEDFAYEYNLYDRGKWFRGPSLSVVTDARDGVFEVQIENVTGEGFPNDLYLDMTTHNIELYDQRFTYYLTIPNLCDGPASYN